VEGCCTAPSPTPTLPAGRVACGRILQPPTWVLAVSLRSPSASVISCLYADSTGGPPHPHGHLPSVTFAADLANSGAGGVYEHSYHTLCCARDRATPARSAYYHHFSQRTQRAAGMNTDAVRTVFRSVLNCTYRVGRGLRAAIANITTLVVDDR